MKVLGVVGPSDAGKTTLVESLTERLVGRGTVSTVKHLTHGPDIDREGKDTARHRAAGAAATVGVTDDAGWFATGSAASLKTILDRLAPSADYVLVEGYSGSNLPKVALGDTAAANPVVATATDATAVDIPSLVSTIEDIEPIETVSSLITRVKGEDDAEPEGVIETFTGPVRRFDLGGDVPTEEDVGRSGSVAESRLASIVRDLRARDGVRAVVFHHRRFAVASGTGTVHFVAHASHRSAALTTVEEGVDRLEAEVPPLEKGMTIDGTSVMRENSGD